jgi:acyl carrier protein
MTQDEALSIVLRSLNTLNGELDAAEQIKISPETKLFGGDSVIDSLALVSMIVDVESDASEALGFPISLSDERAMSREQSPFSTPSTLAAYVVELADEQR